MRRGEIEQQNEAKLRLKQSKNLLELVELAKENRVKLAEAILTENVILEDMKEKSSSLDLPEESLAASIRTKNWVHKNNKRNSLCT